MKYKIVELGNTYGIINDETGTIERQFIEEAQAKKWLKHNNIELSKHKQRVWFKYTSRLDVHQDNATLAYANLSRKLEVGDTVLVKAKNGLCTIATIQTVEDYHKEIHDSVILDVITESSDIFIDHKKEVHHKLYIGPKLKQMRKIISNINEQELFAKYAENNDELRELYNDVFGGDQ